MPPGKKMPPKSVWIRVDDEGNYPPQPFNDTHKVRYVLPSASLSKLEKRVVKAAVKYRCRFIGAGRKLDEAVDALELARRKKKGSHAR